MDLALIKLSIERMLEKVEDLETENVKLKNRLSELEKNKVAPIGQSNVPQVIEDVLLDTKEVLDILGISYNTLRSIISKKLISTIRINQRRIRYSKKAIFAYIESKSH